VRARDPRRSIASAAGRRPPGLSAPDLSRRLGISARRVGVLLTDDAARGMVESDGRGRWRLTARAEHDFGATLRNMMPLDTRPATRLPTVPSRHRRFRV
jgi:hypothetical protein